jgi:hypothetical protein
MRKFSNFFNVSASSAESIKNSFQISSILHGNNSQLIFFIDPHQESLVFVVEDTSTVGPVSVEPNSLEVSITLFEQEMILDELLSLGLSHVVEGVVSTSKIALETLECFNDFLLDFFSLIVSDSGAKGIPIEVSTNSDTSAFDHLGIVLGERWSN